MLSPFLIIGLLEALVLRAEGRMVVEWAIPMLAATAVAVGSRDRRVIRIAGGLLMAVAFGAWLHGEQLLLHGYTTHPRAFRRGTHVVSAWYTPVLGYRRVIRQ
jgi:hypothetical protein